MKLEPLEPDSEKSQLLERYVRQWRTAYRMGSVIANWVAANDKKIVAGYYRKRKHLDISLNSYKRRELRRIFTSMRRKARLAAPDIHARAFQQAWWKGIQNRQAHPYAYRKMALIPKELLKRDGYTNGRFGLRIYPAVELVFNQRPEISQDQSVMLIQRKSGWHLK